MLHVSIKFNHPGNLSFDERSYVPALYGVPVNYVRVIDEHIAISVSYLIRIAII